MTATYDLIASNVLTSNVATVSLSSLPSTYRDLVIVMNLMSTTSGTTVFVRPNGDADNSTMVTLQGTGSTAQSATQGGLSANPISIYDVSPTFNATFQIMDYSATDKHKIALIRANQTLDPLYNAFFGAMAAGGRWANTSAINSLTFALGTGSFKTGSSFYIYGIVS